MSKLTGVFSKFRYLDKIALGDLGAFYKVKRTVFTPEDFLGNRILYPQTLAITKDELNMDFGILIEAVKKEPATFYDVKNTSLVIPEEVMLRFPGLPKLVKTLATALDIQGILPVVIIKGGRKRVGSILRLPFSHKGASQKDYLELLVNNQNVRVKVPGFSDIKVGDSEVSLKILGDGKQFKMIKEMKASGGPLGILVDIYANQ